MTDGLAKILDQAKQMGGTMSWLGKLKAAEAEMAARSAEPWRVRLERVRGELGEDGIERLSTQTVFDYLEMPQRNRGAGAARRLAQVMRDLGWTPVRVRDLTRGGYKEQVRGYCRDGRRSTAPNREREPAGNEVSG